MERETPAGHKVLKKWVEETARRRRPDRIYWCDGSAEETARRQVRNHERFLE